MIPSGYISGLVAWATLPSLTAEQIAARKASLLAEFETLVTGQISGGKTAQALLSASANGKSFTFDASLTKADKIAALTAALRELGVISAGGPTATYGTFDQISR